MMFKHARARLQQKNEAGFSLMEVMIAGLVLVVGLVAVSQFFGSAMGRVMDSRTRSVMHQVGSEEIEKVRALKYADVGIVGSMPGGTLLAHETKVVQGMTVIIDREITFVQDATYTGPYPANYRRVTIRVSTDPNRLQPILMTTNVAGGAAGGAIDVTVTNAAGDVPVPDALIVIINNHLVPNINIHSSSIRTDSAGHLLVPGLTPDATNNYQVQATKAGYNSASSDLFAVADGTTTYKKLYMERLATLVVHTQLADGTPVGNLNLHVSGGIQSFSWAGATLADGAATLTDMVYSTDLKRYTVTLDTGQGYTASPLAVVLPGGSTTDVILEVTPPPTTTTTLATTTTTVVGGTTTTTVGTGTGSLIVRVLRPNGNLLGNVTVSFYNRTSNSNPATFSNIPYGTYLLTVSRGGWVPDPYTGNNTYQANVVINGNVTVNVQMRQQN